MVDRLKRLPSLAALAKQAGGRASLAMILAIVAVMALLPVSTSGSAELPRSSEYELKAAFLYNFVKFTEWPADEMANKSEPFVIGVLGKDPFGAALDKVIEGESFHQKPIVVRRFSRLDQAAANSHVLFVSASEEIHLPAIIKLLEGQAVLTVSEIENFAQRGGVIKLAKESNRVVFEINVDSVKRAGLVMNAQLLRLAKIVKQ